MLYLDATNDDLVSNLDAQGAESRVDHRLVVVLILAARSPRGATGSARVPLRLRLGEQRLDFPRKLSRLRARFKRVGVGQAVYRKQTLKSQFLICQILQYRKRETAPVLLRTFKTINNKQLQQSEKRSKLESKKTKKQNKLAQKDLLREGERDFLEV